MGNGYRQKDMDLEFKSGLVGQYILESGRIIELMELGD